jgi:hypothetical protein
VGHDQLHRDASARSAVVAPLSGGR